MGLIKKKNAFNEIGPVVFTFSLFIITMLFQTNYMNLGTIVSAVVCGLIVVSFFIKYKNIKISVLSVPVISYVLLLFLSTIIFGQVSAKLLQLFVYVLIFTLLSNIEISKKERQFLINAYILSGVLYSILIIYSRLTSLDSYIHSKISLFGTELDPNYVGLPLVCSFSLLLYSILNERKSLIKLVLSAIVLFSILLTSSRGNFVSFAICTIINILYFFKNNKVKFVKKIILFTLVIILFFSFYYFASNNFGSYLDRMFNFSGENASNGRVELWSRAIELWKSRPLFGGGFETMGVNGNLGAHNTYLQLLCDSGIIGFILFIIFLFMILKKSLKNAVCIFAMLLGVFSHSFFLGAVATRCFWATIIFSVLIINSMPISEIRKTEGAR